MLRDRVDAALGSAIRILPKGGALGAVGQSLEEQRSRFLGPIRVALVGRVSAGKSTLANALLGGNVVATGVEELTYNVNWLRNDQTPELTIHYKDGRTERHATPTAEALTDLTARRRQDDQGYLATIDYLVYAYPNRYLADFDLIDTPGLDSHFSDDSANTMRFLGLSEAGVRDATITHAAKADALVLVFSRGMSADEAELLRDFQHADMHSEAASPITTVGALTKVELYWRPDRPDVMAAGKVVADRLMHDAGARRRLYGLWPLASLVGATAETFTEQDFADLTELGTAVEPAFLRKQVSFGPRFSNAAQLDGISMPASRRKSLFERFSAYGIVLACGLIRDGIADEESLRGELSDRSGMTAFRRLLVEHFGHRADVIKLQGIIGHVSEQVDDLADGLGAVLSPGELAILGRAAAQVTQLGFKERAFAEFTVVRDYYSGSLNLTEADAGEALRIVGEFGQQPWQRLGMKPTASTAELTSRARERHAYWAARVAEEGSGASTGRACRTVLRGYEGLIQALRDQ
jgi:Dynamin family